MITNKFLQILESPDHVDQFVDADYTSKDAVAFGFHDGKIITTLGDDFKEWSKESNSNLPWHGNLAKSVGINQLGRENLSPSGRIWTRPRKVEDPINIDPDEDPMNIDPDEEVIVISFWQPPTEEQISETLTEFDEYIGDKKVFVQTKPSNVPEFIGNIFAGLKDRGTAEKLSTADKELMQAQHLSPEVKKYLNQEEPSNVGASKVAARALAAGYDTPAEFNAMFRQESTDRFLFLIENREQYLIDKYKIKPRLWKYILGTDPTGGKYTEWILKMLGYGNLERSIAFPEDGDKVHDTLANFHSLKNKGGWEGDKDINAYKKYGDLARVVQSNIGVLSKREKVSVAEKEGLKLLAEKGRLKLYEVTTNEAGLALGWRDTEWCVKDPHYFDEYGPPFYMVAVDDEPHKLWHPGDRMLMNAWDEPTDYNEFEELGYHDVKNRILENSRSIIRYARMLAERNYQRGKSGESIGFDEGEQVLRQMRDPDALLQYAQAVDERWDEATEDFISTRPQPAYTYAKTVIKGRWPKAEPFILENPYIGYLYAREVIKARWPEVEAAILKAVETETNKTSIMATAASYANQVIKGRWEGFEELIVSVLQNQTLNQSALDHVFYYVDTVLKERWPEIEPYIEDSVIWNRYIRKVWPSNRDRPVWAR